ncbi:MAG: hypothetical protein LBT46_04270 [Planctomycetaceae bacterium]|nr:hypothetical protein [Planctomycetaceae bacterium]
MKRHIFTVDEKIPKILLLYVFCAGKTPLDSSAEFSDTPSLIFCRQDDANQIMMTSKTLTGFCVFVLSGGLFICGCQTPLAIKQLEAKNPLAKNAAKTPAKIVDVWNPCVQTTTDGQALRGLAGRIHFYGNSKKNQAVKVDGDVTVFVFDGQEKKPEHAKPLKVYHFSADVLEKQHYAFKKPLGHGYNFFLPFDALGGPERNLVLMTRFDDRLESQLVIAPPVNTVLSGTQIEEPNNPSVQEFLASRSVLSEANKTIAEQQNGIEQVNYLEEKQKKPEVKKSEQRNISTIRLSENMLRRLSFENNTEHGSNDQK